MMDSLAWFDSLVGLLSLLIGILLHKWFTDRRLGDAATAGKKIIAEGQREVDGVRRAAGPGRREPCAEARAGRGEKSRRARARAKRRARWWRRRSSAWRPTTRWRRPSRSSTPRPTT